MMMHHQTKLGCKSISSSEEAVETVISLKKNYTNPHGDLV